MTSASRVLAAGHSEFSRTNCDPLGVRQFALDQKIDEQNKCGSRSSFRWPIKANFCLQIACLASRQFNIPGVRLANAIVKLSGRGKGTGRRGVPTMARAALYFGLLSESHAWKAVAQFYCRFRKETFGACRSYGRMGKCIILVDLLPRRKPPSGFPLTSGGRHIKLSRLRMANN